MAPQWRPRLAYYKRIRNEGCLAFIFSQPSDRQADTTESQVYDMEELTENAKTVLLENLPQDGGLVRIVTAWPTLSDELKIAIIKMIS